MNYFHYEHRQGSAGECIDELFLLFEIFEFIVGVLTEYIPNICAASQKGARTSFLETKTGKLLEIRKHSTETKNKEKVSP